MALCIAGASIGISQFGIIAFGTFEYLSWDIMEPVAYLMTFTNFTFGYLFYLRAKRDLELSSIYEILTRRLIERACRRNGIDLVKHEELQADIKELQTALQRIQLWNASLYLKHFY